MYPPLRHRVPCLDNPGRGTHGDAVPCNVMSDDRIRADDSPTPDVDPGQNADIVPDPHIVSDVDRGRVERTEVGVGVWRRLVIAFVDAVGRVRDVYLRCHEAVVTDVDTLEGGDVYVVTHVTVASHRERDAARRAATEVETTAISGREAGT